MPHTMIGKYHFGLVALSVVIAIVASYAALDLAGRTKAAEGARRWVWLGGGATAMGLGIWAMHYIGMLAFHLPVPVLYDVPTVILSLLAAIAASAVALFVVSRRTLTVPSLIAGSIVMGSGIAAMHYIGMAAMRLPAICRYDWRIVALSIVLAIVISLVALVLTFLLRDEVRPSSWRKFGSAVLMGVAVPVMHYTGMAAASFTPAPLIADTSWAVSISGVGVAAITAVTFMVLAFAILTSLIDRQLSAQALELKSSENRYRLLFERSLAGFYRSTIDGRILDVNEACFHMFGYASREEYLARNAAEVWFDPADRDEFIARLIRLKNVANAEYRYRRKDGTPVWVLESVALLEGDDGTPAVIEGTMVDITARKQAEQEMHHARAAAESANEIKSEFLGRLVGVVDAMRTGDLSRRLTVDRGNEFGTLTTGFNRMTDELVGLVGHVQESGLQVDASVTDIAATAREQQATASEIATTTIEIGATSREISATSKKLVGTMNDVAAVAEHSAVLAGEGRSSLTLMEDTMRRVMDAAVAINAKLAVLSSKAANISQVVTTITKVADQTNLLSLNAAIEAEKAGEYGRGFAVVATEIRRLADQTAVATYDIDQTVKEIQSAVAAGVMGMDKFSEEVRRGMEEMQHVGSQLSQVIQQVQALAPRVESVNDGMEAQASGAEQITQALTQLSEAAQQTVDSLRHSGQAIDELTRVAVGLRGGVSRFTLQTA
ncbi:MAG: MHYT domain-containing protein [Acidobacteriota bacterium]